MSSLKSHFIDSAHQSCAHCTYRFWQAVQYTQYWILYITVRKRLLPVKHRERNSLSTKNCKASDSTRSLQGMSHMAGFMIHLMHVIKKKSFWMEKNGTVLLLLSNLSSNIFITVLCAPYKRPSDMSSMSIEFLKVLESPEKLLYSRLSF